MILARTSEHLQRQIRRREHRRLRRVTVSHHRYLRVIIIRTYEYRNIYIYMQSSFFLLVSSLIGLQRFLLKHIRRKFIGLQILIKTRFCRVLSMWRSIERVVKKFTVTSAPHATNDIKLASSKEIFIHAKSTKNLREKKNKPTVVLRYFCKKKRFPQKLSRVLTLN